MFDIEAWSKSLREAISTGDAEKAAKLMGENDRNGCFSYEDVCCEFGEMTYEEWQEQTIECAKTVLEDLPNHSQDIKFLVRDDSGRGFTCELKISEFTADEREYCQDPDNLEDTFGDWLDSAEIGDEFTNEDDHRTIIRIS